MLFPGCWHWCLLSPDIHIHIIEPINTWVKCYYAIQEQLLPTMFVDFHRHCYHPRSPEIGFPVIQLFHVGLMVLVDQVRQKIENLETRIQSFGP